MPLKIASIINIYIYIYLMEKMDTILKKIDYFCIGTVGQTFEIQ